MSVVRSLDMIAGGLCLLIAMEIVSWGTFRPEPRQIVRTMQLDNGQIVHVVEPERNCYRLFDHLAAGDAIEVTAPWGMKHRVVTIWCGEYRPEEI